MKDEDPPPLTLSAHQLVQRIFRCVEELERRHLVTRSEALLVRSAALQIRARLLRITYDPKELYKKPPDHI